MLLVFILLVVSTPMLVFGIRLVFEDDGGSEMGAPLTMVGSLIATAFLLMGGFMLADIHDSYADNGRILSEWSLIETKENRRDDIYDEITIIVEDYIDKENDTYKKMTDRASILAFANQRLTSMPLVQQQVKIYNNLTRDIYDSKIVIKQLCSKRFGRKMNPLSTWFTTPGIPHMIVPLVEETFPEYFEIENRK
jgi:hypothetical protein